MTIEQAIEKAIEEGWDDTDFAYTTDIENAASRNVKWEYGKDVFLDPSFWQSLGKALGWKLHGQGYEDITADGLRERLIEEWLYHWHRFIDHLAEGTPPRIIL